MTQHVFCDEGSRPYCLEEFFLAYHFARPLAESDEKVHYFGLNPNCVAVAANAVALRVNQAFAYPERVQTHTLDQAFGLHVGLSLAQGYYRPATNGCDVPRISHTKSPPILHDLGSEIRHSCLNLIRAVEAFMRRQEETARWLLENEELDSRMVSAMSHKDIEGVMTCFADSPDLIAVLWGTEMHGATELRQAVESIFCRSDSLKLTIDRICRIRSGDMVLAVGQATWQMKRGDVVSAVREVWTDVRCRVNGKWVYKLDHTEVLPGT
jgi:hypothetical protein